MNQCITGYSKTVSYWIQLLCNKNLDHQTQAGNTTQTGADMTLIMHDISHCISAMASGNAHTFKVNFLPLITKNITCKLISPSLRQYFDAHISTGLLLKIQNMISSWAHKTSVINHFSGCKNSRSTAELQDHGEHITQPAQAWIQPMAMSWPCTHWL